ncbi:cupredoxin domain-containing protein [Sulfurisoma sediminicola]|jgi:plastocyanin|uniref:EfeO-type cupredoxin-like domain-containing protein n=1 Tax=Sulfurisoma sediminicola TaxID=1381557 RepID=A0A497XE22_9PROT|nr:cupredoxin domain-containing protein [Sulfurisoma sediminicola]RLJ65230.1 hypothetical protein DFR35_1887 [Sulfurisoma sediminicola]
MPRTSNRLTQSAAFLVLLLSAAFPARAADDVEVAVAIRDHRFEPAELRVPANRKVKLLVENHDATAEEFESHELNREKIVPAKGKVAIYIGPLASGRYPFYGEYHDKTARGVVVAE